MEKAKNELKELESPRPKNKTQLALDELELANERKRLLNWRLKWDNRLRLVVAGGVFGVVILWLGAVITVIAAQTCPRFTKLSDNVLLGLLATTTANIAGLLFTVVQYLFPKAAKPGD